MKPEFWTDSKTGTLSPLATKLFLGLLSFSDDYGVIEFDQEALRVRIMPYYSTGTKKLILEPLLNELVPKGLVVISKLENREFLWIKNFKKHQKVDHPGKALISENPEQNLTPLANPRESSLLKGMDSKGMEGNSKTPHTPQGADLDFEQFWKAYPKKVAKGAAQKAFAKHKPTQELVQRMLTALDTQARTEQWNKDNGKFIPHPATWLNQLRWEDEVRPPKQTNGFASVVPGKYDHLS